MTHPRHCRHCAGNCPGDCIVDDSGMCIHGWNVRPPLRLRWQVLISRRWWRRVLWGVQSR